MLEMIKLALLTNICFELSKNKYAKCAFFFACIGFTILAVVEGVREWPIQ